MPAPVEVLTISLAVGVATASANLTGGQTLANCIPFRTRTVANAVYQTSKGQHFTIEFETGPDRVTITRANTTYACDAIVTVVEYDPLEWSVQSGAYNFSYGAATKVISLAAAVDETKAFPLVYQDEASASDRWQDAVFTGSSDEITLTRVGTSIALDGHWYVLEYIGTGNGISVQTATTSASLGTATIASAVDEDKTFLIGYYRTADASSEHGRYAPYLELTSSTQVTVSAYTAPATEPSMHCYVVEFDAASDGTAQRGLFTIAIGSNSDTATITAVDLSRAVAKDTCHHVSGYESYQNRDARSTFSIELTSTTAVDGVVLGTEGTSCGQPWEVIEWPSAAATTNMSGTAAALATVAGAIEGAGETAGTAAGAATVAGAIDGAAGVAGTAAALATVAGAIEGAGETAGTAAGSATVAAAIAGVGETSGTSTGVATAPGAITGVGEMAGTAAGVATVEGVIADASDSSVAGTAAGVATAVGAIVGVGEMRGTAAGVATVVGTIVAPQAIAGTAAGAATVVGAITGVGEMRGTSAAASTVAGVVEGGGELTGLAAGLATVAGVIVNGLAVELAERPPRPVGVPLLVVEGQAPRFTVEGDAPRFTVEGDARRFVTGLPVEGYEAALDFADPRNSQYIGMP